MALPRETIHRFPVEDYLRLVEADPSLERTELVEGVIVDMAAESIMHARAVEWVHEQLATHHLGRVHSVGSVQLDTGIWNPDVYVLSPDWDDDQQYVQARDVLLVVEVNITTALRDLHTKRLAYARNEIPFYWVLSPESHRIQIFSQPQKGDYRTVNSPDLAGDYRSLDVAQWV